MNVRFYLKNPKAKNVSAVYVDFSINGIRFQTSIGCSIEPKHWNAKSGKPIARYYNNDRLEQYLRKAENCIKDYCLDEKVKGNDIDKIELINHLNKTLNNSNNDRTSSKKSDFILAYETYLEEIEKTKKYGTLQIKKQLIKELILFFNTELKKTLSFKNIDSAFYTKYLQYLSSIKNTNSNKKVGTGLLDDTINKRLTNLKSFMSWAEGNGLHSNGKYRKFRIPPKTKKDNVYFNLRQLSRLQTLVLSHNPRLDRVRDMLLILCYTGVRWSDLINFKHSDIVPTEINGESLMVWKFVSVKTRTEIEIPLNGMFKEVSKVFDKYQDGIPKISNQKFNNYCKELCKLAGFDEMKIIKRTKDNETIEINEPFYELVSSHTGRRTFITNNLAKGMNHAMVMKFTGHKNVGTLFKYENIDLKDKINAAEKYGN